MYGSIYVTHVRKVYLTCQSVMGVPGNGWRSHGVRSVLQCVVLCCGVLQRVAVCCSV